MSDSVKKKWFFVRGFDKAATLFSQWFPPEPERHPDTEAGELEHRILLNKSYIDNLSSYWYSLPLWGKLVRVGAFGIAALALGIVVQAPVLVFGLYLLAATILHSILASHEEHRRFTSKVLVNESQQLTCELNELKQEHVAINANINLLVERLEGQITLFNQKVELLSDTINRIELEGKRIPGAFAAMRAAVEERIDIEKKIITCHEERGAMLSKLDADLDVVTSVVEGINNTLDAFEQSFETLNENEEHIDETLKINAHALFQPAPALQTISSIASEYLENAAKRREYSDSLKEFINENNAFLTQRTQRVY